MIHTEKIKPAPYYKLRMLMGKYILTTADIARVSNMSYRHVHAILNRQPLKSGKVPLFNIEASRKILFFFRNLGETITADELFFDEMVTNETKTA